MTEETPRAVRCVGAGTPVVILVSGLQEPGSVWDAILPQLGRLSQACSYDRPGTSGAAPREIRSFDDAARELRTLAQSLSPLSPPVLVGHSIGGLLCLRYVELFRDVAGLVLVDSSHPLQVREIEMILDSAEYRDDERVRDFAVEFRRFSTDPNANRERLDVTALDQLMPGLPNLGTLPVAIVSAGAIFAELGSADGAVLALRQCWLALQGQFTALSARTRHEVVPAAGHYVFKTEPQPVLDAVAWVLDQVRSDLRAAPDAP